MTWPDYLAVIAMHLIALGSLAALWCFRKSQPSPPCDCEACVDNSLALVERDTQKASVKK